MTLPGTLDAGLPTVSGRPWPGVRYFCTTRQGGASVGPWSSLNLGRHTRDDPAHVDQNRALLLQHLPAAPLWLDQVHGSTVLDADLSQPSEPGRQALPVADAAVTTRPGTVLAIMTADCLPVVIASMDGRALGVAHAGWRGLAAGVLENTLAALRLRADVGTTWQAWVGPAISRVHFEVGPDVYEAFTATDPEASAHFAPGAAQKWMADLPALARRRLLQAGIQQVELSGVCTYAQADKYYSFRRNPTTGRQATLAWLAPA